ncbi:NAD(P)/FAD-dependent oxidoreductase [Labrys wisconsinensis]|uniref:Nitrite reductase (NADH) large subunit n=1 Tax=Labrys wisconsinensis TaxID=425677 RepID=A0ABU0J1J0_9HYPH|nr:FAD-dependent oxidoreductase [Labrys wisconsinensis]MDQ0468108.1 nitrite reductase (NADH) large subunit [Labrys wisconsinensis]
MTENLLIVGNGMASVRLCEELAARAPGRFAVTVVGAEPLPGYNRVLLSALLAGEVGEADIALCDTAWYAAQGIRLITGRRVEALDLPGRAATLSDGGGIGFDRLVLATGSTPIRLAVPGMDLPGVMTFRDLADLPALGAAARSGGRVAVIGGGLLGIEAAHALAKGGADVTLVHVTDRLMDRQLDVSAAAFLRRAVERKGIRLRLSAQTAAVDGAGRAEALVLADGERLPTDLVVVAVGVRPNVALAAAAGLPVGRGILVDDGLTTSLPFVHAVGECAEHRGMVYGLVEPAYDQVGVLARRLAGEAEALYGGTALSTNLKVSGVPVFSAGDVQGEAGTDAILLEDRGLGLFRKLVLRGDRLVGAVLVGEADDALWYRDLIRRGDDVAAIRDDLIFGRAFCDGAIREAA